MGLVSCWKVHDSYLLSPPSGPSVRSLCNATWVRQALSPFGVLSPTTGHFGDKDYYEKRFKGKKKKNKKFVLLVWSTQFGLFLFFYLSFFKSPLF